MRVDATTLTADEIDHPQIREAADRFAAATLAVQDRERALAKLTDEREQAKQADAEMAEAALAAGKSAPRRRHVAEYEKRLADLEHEVRVDQFAAKRSLGEFQMAVDTHLAEWIETQDRHVGALDDAWASAVAALETLHRERVGAYRRRSEVGGEVAAIGSIRLKPWTQLHGIDIAHYPDPAMRHKLRAYVTVEDALRALADVAKPEELEPMPGGQVGADLKRSLEHARAVKIAHETNRVTSLGAIRQMPRPDVDVIEAKLTSSVPDRITHRERVEARRAELAAQEG